MKNRITSFFPSLTIFSPLFHLHLSSLFLTSLTVLTVLSANAQVPSYVPTNGLVGYWPFNGNANDESGNGNNGTVNGATLTADRFGDANKAYDFDGFTSINFTIQELPISNSERSFSFWAKQIDQAQSFNGAGTIFNYGENQFNKRFGCMYWPELPMVVAQANDACFGCSGSNGFQNVSGLLGTWNNVTITFNSEELKCFVNSELYFSANISYNTSISDLVLGLAYPEHEDGERFVGHIDDIGIWNRALTADEVLTLYNGCNVAPLAVSGNVTPTQFTQETYTYPNTVGSTYNWTVTNGVILSGQGTNSIDVMWANTGIGEISVAETNATNCTGDVVTYDVVVIPTNVEELSNQLILYPNPVTTNLTLQVKSEMIGSDFVVFDALGKVVLRDKIMSSNQNISVINLSNGNYILRVGAMNKVFTISK